MRGVVDICKRGVVLHYTLFDSTITMIDTS
jgi:hypothetical protein